MSIHFHKLRDECYRKVYSYKCDDHMKCEVVSTRRYPLACTKHVPIYLFTGIDEKSFVHFHWVSSFFLNSFYTKKAGTFNLKAFNFSTKQKVELEPTTTICTRCGMNLTQRLNLHELGIHFDLCLTIVPIYDGICRLCGRVSLVILDP